MGGYQKFCNSISLETDESKSWRKIKNFLKPKDQHGYPTLRHDDKVAKTNADKGNSLPNLFERHSSIESDNFDSNHFSEVNQFIEDSHKYCYRPEDPDDYRFDVGNDSPNTHY